MVAMTASSEGCAIATEKQLVQVPVVPLDEVVDATGAGDAFLGGLIAS
jgi:sugar/nucleoside kinase (ribokinase family)